MEVLSRVRSEELRVVELQHRSAGQPSNHGDAKKFRQKVLGLVREKYGDAVGDGLGRRWPRSIWRPRSSLTGESDLY